MSNRETLPRELPPATLILQQFNVTDLHFSHWRETANSSSVIDHPPIPEVLPGAPPGITLETCPNDDPRPAFIAHPSLRCPTCGSAYVRRASRSGRFDRIIRFLGLAPYRCRACRRKFYRL